MVKLPKLLPNEIHVWSAERTAVDIGPAERLLDRGELDRARRRGGPAGRRHLAAHMVLRRIVAGYLGDAPEAIRFDRHCAHCGSAEHGKPAADPAVDVSLSHSGELSLVAICRAPFAVGVDVERLRSGVDWAAVSKVPSSGGAAGFQEWTRAEAVVKAAGLGLAGTPRIRPDAERGWRRGSVDGLPDPWHVRDLRCPPGYAAAVATSDPGASVRMFSWSE